MSGRWAGLAAQLEGALVLPGDPAMAAVNKQYACALPLPEPQALLICASTSDVQRGYAHASEHGLSVAIRSGGHCFGDLSSGAGVVLDLSRMNEVVSAGRGVGLGPGALAGETARVLAAEGRMIPTGGCPLVAMGGLALAGGFGFLGRRYGLTCDQVERMEVVLPDGRVVLASEEHEAELFWALRGGGALGFGAVTRLWARTHELAPLAVVNGRWPLAEAAALIEEWQNWAPDADDAVNLELGLVGSDFLEDPPFVELFGIVAGTEAEVRPHLSTLARRLGPLADGLAVWNVAGDQAALYCCGLLGHRLQEAWLPSRPYGAPGFQATRSHFFDAPFGRPAIDDCVRLFAAERQHAQYRELEFVPWGGAYARGGGAFPHRGARVLVRHTATTGARATEALRAHASDWARSSFEALDAHSNGSAYPGYAEPARPDWQRACYGAALPRLLALRRRTTSPASATAAG